jgi:hypothetical protein
MRIIPLVSITIALLGATACSYERTSAYTSDEQIAMAPAVTVIAPAATVDTIVPPDAPVLRARDGDPTTLNSENHSVVTRTGLNSNPGNPDGTPRPSVSGTAYGG